MRGTIRKKSSNKSVLNAIATTDKTYLVYLSMRLEEFEFWREIRVLVQFICKINPSHPARPMN